MSEMEKEKYFSKEKKDDDTVKSLPYQNLQKSSVLQEARIFNETPIQSRKCMSVVQKILYQFGQGEVYTAEEATELFFSVTKLFISGNIPLRRLIWVLVKELSKSAEQTFVASNILFQDMNKNMNTDMQANAIRALRTITDETMLNQLDRHVKEAVVSSNPSVSSSALLSGLLLTSISPDMVKRWAGEIQSVLKTPPKNSRMVQYHAIAVLYYLKQHDPLAVSKLITSNTSGFRSPLSNCLLIKYSIKVLKGESSKSERTKAIFSFLENCLNYESDMVILEAARAMCSLDLSPKELTPSVTALGAFLDSHKQIHKFAALRTLNSLASKYPLLVALCNVELDRLISDANRNIATLAITTLLKTGDENNVDRLMKQISNFMHDISDEFKVTVIQEMRVLCLKYSSKHNSVLTFLNSALRDDGGYEFKKSVVDAIIDIITTIKESKDNGISYLCEFIEDCEFPLLLQQVLHFLGEEGPNSSKPSKCIRYIYNRILLEKAPVRSAAVSTLAKFAAKVPELQKSIMIILKRTLNDSDDDVRDRALFCLNTLKSNEKKNEILAQNVLPLDKVELVALKFKEDGDFSKPFVLGDLSNVHLPVKMEQNKQQEKEEIIKLQPKSNSLDLLNNIPQLKALGKPFNISSSIALTDVDSDYVVDCIKYVYKKNIVFQFDCVNKVDDRILENVGVDLDFKFDGIEEEFQAKASQIPFNSSGSIFVCCERTEENDFATGKILVELTFDYKEVDPSTGEIIDDEEIADEYPVDKLQLNITDYSKETDVEDFKEKWNELGEENDTSGSLTIKASSLQESVDKFIDSINLNSLNDNQVSKKSHGLFFSGEYCTPKSNFIALLSVKLTEKDGKFASSISVRSPSKDLRQLIPPYLKKSLSK
eukprot:gene2274-2448_t